MQILNQSRSRFSAPEAVCLFLQRVPNSSKRYFYFTFFRLAAAVFRNHLSPGTSWKQSRMVHESNNTELSKSTFSPADNRPRMHALLNGFDLNCLKPTTLHLLSSSKYFVFIRIFAPGLLRRYLKNWVGVDFNKEKAWVFENSLWAICSVKDMHQI